MIRRATLDDLAEVVEVGARFLAYSPYAHIPLDRDAFEAFAAQLITGPGAIFLSDDGMIGGLLNPAYFNPAYVMAAELFWYAPKDGQALMDAFETWAVMSGARAIQFTGLRDRHAAAIERVFARRGYRPVETGFIKEL